MAVTTALSRQGLEEAILKSPQVQSTIGRLANGETGNKERLAAKALEYLSGIRADPSPRSIKLYTSLAHAVSGFSFENVKCTGLEGNAAALKKGGVALLATHFSYLDIFTVPHVLDNKDLYTHTIAGENIASIPVIGYPLGKFLRRTGAIFVKRDMSEGDEESKRKEGKLYRVVLQAYISHLHSQKQNVLMFGSGGKTSGRYKTGKVEPISLSALFAFLAADKLLPVATTYEIIADDNALVSSAEMREKTQTAKRSFVASVRKKMSKPPSFLQPLRLAFLDGILNGPYGTVHVRFGEPLETTAYVDQQDVRDGLMLPPEALKRLRYDVTQSQLKLMTLTPVSALAVLLSSRGTDSFRVEDLVKPGRELVQRANDSGVCLSDKLLDMSIEDALSHAITALAQRGGVKEQTGRAFSVTKPRLLTYYENTISPTLKAYGVTQQANG